MQLYYGYDNLTSQQVPSGPPKSPKLVAALDRPYPAATMTSRPSPQVRTNRPVRTARGGRQQPKIKASVPSFTPARRSGTSLHHQIFLVLRDRIQSGAYAAGSMLPTEEELSQQFGVSRITIRAALTNLQSTGLIERKQGVGTFVSAEGLPTQLHTPLADLVAHIADVGRTTKVALLHLDVVRPTLQIAALFGSDPEERFQRAIRLRSMNGVPIFHVVTYIPERIAREFTRKEMSGPSLYRLLADRGYKFKSGKQVASAVLADPAVAARLQVEVGAPLLQIRRIHYDDGMQPFEYFEMLASPSKFELQMTLGEQDMPSSR